MTKQRSLTGAGGCAWCLTTDIITLKGVGWEQV